MIGCLCDKYVKLRKPFLIAAPGSVLLGNLLGLLQIVFFNELGINTLIASYVIASLIGSFQAGLTLSFAYISANSTEANRALKFFTFDVSYVVGLSIGSLVSGQLLGQSSWINGSEIRNYSSVYLIGACSALCSILWVSFGVRSINKLDNKLSDNGTGSERDSDEEEGKISFRDVIKEALNLKAIVLSFKNALAKHTKSKQKQILILISAVIIIQLEQIGMYRILYSYTQRVYRWNYEIYSIVSTVSTVTNPVVSIITLPLLTKVFKLLDIEIAVIGMVSLLMSTIPIGSILTPAGFYCRIIFGVFASMLNPSIRSKLSKIIHPKETTKIFAAMTIMEVLCPFLSTLLYTEIFNATISGYPSLIFQISAMTLFVPLILLMFIEFKYDRDFL